MTPYGPKLTFLLLSTNFALGDYIESVRRSRLGIAVR